MSVADDRPTPKIEVSFVENPSYPDDWTDITAYVLLETVVIESGRSDELDSMQAGTLTFQVRNDDRRFDPDYASGPYYPHVRPNKRIRITATWSGTDYSQFVGFVRDWGTYRRTELAIASVQCVDALGTAFAQSTIPETLILAIGQVDSALHVDPFTGDSAALLDSLIPMTTLQLDVDDGASGGTFRIRYNGTYTAPIAYTATGDQIVAALELVMGVSAGSVMANTITDTITSAPAGMVIYFGGDLVGVDVSSLIEVDFSSLTPTTGFVETITAPPVTNVLPTIAAIATGRDYRCSLEASSATIGTPTRVWFVYNDAGGRLLKRTSVSLYDGVLSADILTGERTYTIALGPNVADATRQVTVGLVTDTIASDLSGAMFTAAAIIAGWSEGEIDADAGESTLQAIDPVGTSPINLFQLIANSEGGIYYVSREGMLTFTSRSSAAGGSVVAALTGDEYEDVATSHGERYIYNDVTVTREGGTAQRAQDGTSIARYYLRAFSESGLLITTDAEALSRARALRARYKEPRTRITSVRPLGVADPATLWPIILSAELTNKYSIGYAVLPGGTEVAYVVRLERKRLEITATNWRVEWSLSPTTGSAFILGTSVLGGPDVLFY